MNAAGSKVNHSAVSSSGLCCRPLPPLFFLPLPPPLVCSGFWWAVVKKYAQLIAKADFYPCGNLHSQCFFTWADLFTHTGAGSEQAGGVLTLMVGVTADNRHLHPHWLI